MKLFRNFILLFVTILVFEFTFVKNADAAECAKNGDVFNFITEGCEAQPDGYEVVVYKLYLCTSSPAIPTTTSVVDLVGGGCIQIFDNPSGATAAVTQGSELDLTGTYTRPPNNTYTHGYAVMGNTFGITASIEIEDVMNGQTGGRGVFCGTVAGSGTTNTKSMPNNTSVCSSSPVSAGKFVETLADFPNDEGGFGATAQVENINDTTAAIMGILVNSSGQLAAADSDVDKLEGLVTFANAVSFIDAVTEATIFFNVGSGMTLFQDENQTLSMSSGPFQAIITTN